MLGDTATVPCCKSQWSLFLRMWCAFHIPIPDISDFATVTSQKPCRLTTCKVQMMGTLPSKITTGVPFLSQINNTKTIKLFLHPFPQLYLHDLYRLFVLFFAVFRVPWSHPSLLLQVIFPRILLYSSESRGRNCSRI